MTTIKHDLTTGNTESMLFSHFTADEFLASLVMDANIHIVDGNVIWDQPASNTAIVRDGLITNVPGSWTYGDLLLKLVASRVGSEAVQLSVAKVAIYEAHRAACLARAAAASAEALQQEADELAKAAADVVEEIHKLDVTVDEDTAERYAEVNTTISDATEGKAAAEYALAQARAHEEDAATAVVAAEEAIKQIPAPARRTYVATLAPDFAHLAGDMEETDGHPPKPSFSGVPADLFGFVCTGCKAYNLVRSGQKNWYTVFAGEKIGVFYGNHNAMPLVTNVKRASMRGFITREEAEAAFVGALYARTARVIRPDVV